MMVGWMVVYLPLAAFAVGATLGAWLTARTRHPHWLCGYCAEQHRRSRGEG